MKQTQFAPTNHEGIRRRDLRKRAGLTLFVLAGQVGKSAGTLSQWERRQVELPRSDVEKIARVISNELSKMSSPNETEIVNLLLELHR